MTDNYAALLRQTAKLYRESLAAPDTNDMCTLAYQWQDKKHRHVWDLCKELEKAADYNEKIKAQLELEVDDLKICRSERLELYIRIEKLEAELHHCFHRVEELQAALREIIVHCEVPAPPNAEALKMFARKALEGKDD